MPPTSFQHLTLTVREFAACQQISKQMNWEYLCTVLQTLVLKETQKVAVCVTVLYAAVTRLWICLHARNSDIFINPATVLNPQSNGEGGTQILQVGLQLSVSFMEFQYAWGAGSQQHSGVPEGQGFSQALPWHVGLIFSIKQVCF